MNASSHDILMPMLNHHCCKNFESSGSFYCSCIQFRKLKKNEKHSLTGEQPKIYRLCCLVAKPSGRGWLCSIATLISLELAANSLCTAQQPFPNGLVRLPKRFFFPFHYPSAVLVIKIIKIHSYDT